MDEIIKGKMLLQEETPRQMVHHVVPPAPWPPPPSGWTALPVDGSFSGEDGSVIFSAYQVIFHCNEALEAEIHALLQGMALAAQHTDRSVMVQADSLEVLSILVGDNWSRSAYGHLVVEIKAMMIGREFIPQKISRAQNRVADCMANYSRAESCTAVWMSRCPPCCEDLLPLDCNPLIHE